MLKNIKKNLKDQSAYTLSELIVIIGVIVIVSSLVLANYNHQKQSSEAFLAAQKIASDIRMAAGWSMSLKEFNNNMNNQGWGLHFSSINPNNDKYTVFANQNYSEDCSNTSCMMDGGEAYTSFSLLNESLVTDIAIDGAPRNNAYILFVPPKPKVIFCRGNNQCFYDEVEIELNNGESTILINKYGLVDVNN